MAANSWFLNNKLLIASLLLAILFLSTSAIWIGTQVFAFNQYQMDYDEAVHANRGLDMASAVVRSRLAEIWQHTIRPHLYPPAHGFFLGGWFLALGADITMARLYSTLCYFLLGLVLWFSAREIMPQASPLFYLLPPLFLIADTLHVDYAALAMLEMPVMLLTLVSLLFFVRGQRKSQFMSTLPALIFGLLTFLTKYNYGLVLLATLALCSTPAVVNQLKSRTLRPQTKTQLAAWLPVLAALIIWLFALNGWTWLRQYAAAQPETVDIWSVENFTFYLSYIWSTSWGWLTIFLVTIGAALWIKERWLPPTLTPYLIYFAIGFAMLTYTPQNNPRFGMLLFPSLWMCAFAGAVTLSKNWPGRFQHAFSASVAALLLFWGWQNQADFTARLTTTVYENTNAQVNQAYGLVAVTTQANHSQAISMVMLGRTDQWNSQTLHFYLESHCKACAVSVADELDILYGWPRTWQTLSEQTQRAEIEAALKTADFLILFAAIPGDLTPWTPIAQQDFIFERHQFPPTHSRVTILTKK